MNTRGLENKIKRKAIFAFYKGLKAHIKFIQETHLRENDANFWSNQWGDRMTFSHGSPHSGGVAIPFNDCLGKDISYKAAVLLFQSLIVTITDHKKLLSYW